MLAQDTLTGYLHEVPDYQPTVGDFAEAPEPYLAEYWQPSVQVQAPPPYPGAYQTSPGTAWTAPPWWWRAPFIHWSWANEWKPWRRPLYGLARFWLQQPFSPASLEARRNAYFRWSQQQGMAPWMPGGMLPGMYPPPGMLPTPGMPTLPMPVMPGVPSLPAPGMPGVPGLPAPGMPAFPGMPRMTTRSRRRGRRRRRR